MTRVPILKEAFARNRMVPSSLVNMYPRRQPNTPEGVVLTSVPCLENFVVSGLGDGPIRGTFYLQGALESRFYVVSGDTVYWIDRLGTVTTVGTIAGGATPVRMASDTISLVIVADPQAWVVTAAGGVNEITDPDFPSVTDVAYLNGYFFFTRRDSGEYIWSAIADPTNYDALDFATAEAVADNNVGLLNDSTNMYFFGSASLEIHQGTGNADAPLRLRPGGVRTTGCASRDTIVRADNTLYFLGNDGIFYRLANADFPEAVSNGEVEEALRDLTESQLAGVRCFTHSWDGSYWIYLSIPGKGTFVYDIRTGVWFERSSWEQTLFVGGFETFAYGTHYIGDRNEGKIYALRANLYQDAGGVFERKVSMFVPTENKGAKLAKIFLDCTTGDGLQSGQGSDPQVMFRFSKDGGRTFTSEITRSIGKVGEYEKPVIFRNQGRFDAPGCALEFRVTDPVAWDVYGLRVNE